MRLLTYGDPADYAVGVSTDAGVLDLAAASAEFMPEGRVTARTLFSRGIDALADVRSIVDRAGGRPDLFHQEEGLHLGPTVPYPGKIICIGLNYGRHAAETGLELPTTPIVFSKFADSLAAHHAVISLPRVSQQVDYEAELAVVIGARARDIPPEDALDVVLGYATANDVSARDLQMRTSQWLLGKTLPGFLPIGPYVVTADDVPDPQRLRLRTWVNGAVRQDSNTSDMIFDVAFLISYLSAHIALDPGDVILTGTPAGVIAGMKDPVWLKDGDIVVIEVEGLGQLENVFRAEP